SCNPATFRDDVNLLQVYRIDFFEAYDMFPQTPHLETLALLSRK
ncbi:MAG TPA: 23S rRNA (uracil(1939)-C(5))-methyltransferase RlmD, partial [Spirochaetota bacterium]|nr:23S rRNA (uracil(1939)-C(5))-methyltransferase RlmD [Spirochaetota bacterium]